MQLMIYDDPSMTQLVPGATVLPPVGLPPLGLPPPGLPPSMPVLGLAPGQEGTTAGMGVTRTPLPAEEIRIYLEQKLRELERTDSALSGR